MTICGTTWGLAPGVGVGTGHGDDQRDHLRRRPGRRGRDLLGNQRRRKDMLIPGPEADMGELVVALHRAARARILLTGRRATQSRLDAPNARSFALPFGREQTFVFRAAKARSPPTLPNAAEPPKVRFRDAPQISG
jgi:hypothetical protein